MENRWLALVLVLGSGCYDGVSTSQNGAGAGSGDGASGGPSGGPSGEPGTGGTSDTGGGEDGGIPAGIAGMRRLTAAEYDSTLSELLGMGVNDAQSLLPEDVRSPFDNDFTNQNPSKALIEAVDFLAQEAAAALVADIDARSALVGCTPSDSGDVGCMKQFVGGFLRHAFRRPVESAMVDAFVDLGMTYANEKSEFYDGVETIVHAVLVHHEFLYRIEMGSPVEGSPGVFRLNDHEVATRLSYFIWGTTPTQWLLDRADAGELSEPAAIASVAGEMLGDPRAQARILRFHSMWLDYESLPHDPELSSALTQETEALLSRVLFDENRPWQDLWRFTETYIDAGLAEHYGLEHPGGDGPAWVPYGDSGRQGLLSHGSFLSVGAKFDDTSPTLRGKVVRERIFCEEVAPPPPEVNTDDPISEEEGECKLERYSAHASGGCANCHDFMDPIGFGLERYDQEGRYREHDNDKPQCVIAGVGEVAGIGTFEGPAGLADLVLETGHLDRCAVTQVFRFAMGHFDLDPEDETFVELVSERLAGPQGFTFEQLMIELVSSSAFSYRREEAS